MCQKVCMVFLTLLSCLTLGWSVTVVGFDSPDPLISKDENSQQQWVDSVFNSMRFEDRLGQLFMVAAYSNKDHRHQAEITRLVEEEKLGGLIFFQGGPVRQAHLTNHYQKVSKVPLFIAMDAEWGPGMRLDSVLQFQKQMTLGAGGNDRLVYEMGKEIARQFKEMGMHINFAPVVDVNSNPDNPVIGYRSFGEEKSLVSRKSLAYMRGMQDHGVMANAKHFPGHGDTNVDSHYATPVIHNTRAHIHDIDLYPYRELINEGLMSVMVAHLHVPSLGSEAKKPTTLSPAVVNDLLKRDLGFKGLIFTDALNMKGVSNLYPPGEVDLLALKAGNDVLLYAEDVPKSKALIMKAIENGELSREEVDQRIRKILAAKYWAGLHQKQPVNPERLVERISNFGTKALIEQLYASSITVAKNGENVIPLKHLDLRNMASLTIGGRGEVFKGHLDKYGAFTHYTMRGASGPANYKAMEENLKSYNTIVVGVMGMSNNPRRNFGIQASDVDFVKRLNEKHNVITVVFGNAYGAGQFQDLPNLVLAYEENEFTEKLVPQVLFGARPATGTLPVTIGEKLLIGAGEQVNSLGRLAYSTPENQGMDSRRLMEIDRLMEEAIRRKATPGGTVLVAKNGHVVFEKSYGYTDYGQNQPVTPKTIYDLASLTKVLSTTQMMMFLHSRGMIEMDKNIGEYLQELDGTNKYSLKLADIMTHEAGLVGWIPHYSLTMEGKEWKPGFYGNRNSEEYPYPIADGIWGNRSLPDSVWHWTIASDLRRTGKLGSRYTYLYSDVGMYLLHRMVERMTGQSIDEFMRQNFYDPLGLNRMGFHPLKRFDKSQIAPTELDRIYRKTLVHGHVHDPGAAMYGGVAGHAGLFGTAHDVAVVMQTMLQGGNYGGLQLLAPETVSLFTENQSAHSRRGWGWDKPEPNVDKRGAVGKLASRNTFGHTGFTGTAAWADPDQGLVYVFLSNRVHPDAGNNLITKEKLRGAIHDIIYRSISQPLLLANN